MESDFSIKDIEKLITNFQATVPVVEELTSKINIVLNDNKKMKAAVDNNALVSILDKDVIETLYLQKMINKSIMYSLLDDDEHLNDILRKAKAFDDKEVLSFWFKIKNKTGKENE